MPQEHEAAEVTPFRRARGASGKDLLAASQDINEYRRGQPGFRWRRIRETADGYIIDIVAYDSADHARSGATGITGEMPSFMRGPAG